jgi:hypothetical protein
MAGYEDLHFHFVTNGRWIPMKEKDNSTGIHPCLGPKVSSSCGRRFPLQRLVHGWVSVNEWKDIDHCDRDFYQINSQ